MEILVPHLDNPSGEALFRSNNIMQENETIKLQNEEVMLKLDYWWTEETSA